MSFKVRSATLIGINAYSIDIEVDSNKALPGETIIGLPDTVIKESKNRVKSAIKAIGYTVPNKHYIINLSPAETKKEGALLDVPIAMALLHYIHRIKLDKTALYVGELGLSGDIKPIRGILAICELAIKTNISTLYIPYDNYAETTLFPDLNILPVKSLLDIITHIELGHPISKPQLFPPSKNHTHSVDYSEVKGQFAAKRALEIAAAGHHNVLFIGPPGSGKSMLMKRFTSILPDMNHAEKIETLKIHSISAKGSRLVQHERPFRAPHHSVSYAGLSGGGSIPQPGEISLAHNGVLFLDELPEYPRNVIEVLRQPLEEKKITISRSQFSIEYPANFLLLSAMNPCPCGYFLDPTQKCSCQPGQIQKYWKKISGPILDRIDIILDIPKLNKEDFFKTPDPKNSISEQMKSRVIAARNIQNNRTHQDGPNGTMTPKQIQAICTLTPETKDTLRSILTKGALTGRSFDKILKLSRTIADLDNEDEIKKHHIMEAYQYRKTRYKPGP